MMWSNNIKPQQPLICLTLFFLLILPGVTVAARKKVNYDSAVVGVKKIPAEEINRLKEDADYDYMQTTSSPKTAWERFKEWLWKKISELFSTKAGVITFQIIKYLLVAAAVFLIIFLLLKNNVRALFYGKSSMVSSDFTELTENIHEIDFDKRIADEIANRDFRKAVRLYFLKIIRDLSRQNIILWKLDKTNADYLKELRSKSYYSQFAELSRLYEYIWYGDFPLDEAKFLAVIQKFNQFKTEQTS